MAWEHDVTQQRSTIQLGYELLRGIKARERSVYCLEEKKKMEAIRCLR